MSNKREDIMTDSVPLCSLWNGLGNNQALWNHEPIALHQSEVIQLVKGLTDCARAIRKEARIPGAAARLSDVAESLGDITAAVLTIAQAAITSNSELAVAADVLRKWEFDVWKFFDTIKARPVTENLQDASRYLEDLVMALSRLLATAHSDLSGKMLAHRTRTGATSAAIADEMSRTFTLPDGYTAKQWDLVEQGVREPVPAEMFVILAFLAR